MIKINLLPVPKGKKKNRLFAEVKLGFPVVLLSWGLTLLFVIFVHFRLSAKATELFNLQVQSEEELAKIKTVVEEVENFEKLRSEFLEKIVLIEKLRENQQLPVHVLDDISRGLPEKVWLSSLEENAGLWEIGGMALSNTDIVDFINGLKASEYFSEIMLLESVQQQKHETSVYTFKLQLKATT